MTQAREPAQTAPTAAVMTTTPIDQARGPSLTSAPIPTLLVQLAAPAAIGFLFSTLYNLVDSFWANRLGASLGTSDPIDALGAGSGYFFFMLAVAIGLNQGSTAMMTNALGQGRLDLARTAFFQTLVVGAAASVLLAVVGLSLLGPVLDAQFAARPQVAAQALSYLVPIYVGGFSFVFTLTANAALSSQGDFVTLGVVQILGFLLNCVLNPIFMFGWGPVPAMGLFGLALATISINIVGLGIILVRTARSAMFAGMEWRALSFDTKGLGDLARQSVPATLNMAVIGLGYLVINVLVNNFGPGAMGGVSNAMRLEQLILLPIIGLQIAVLAIIGQNMGAKHFERVAATFNQGLSVALGIMGAGMVLTWIFYNAASGLFAAGNPAVQRMSNLYLIYSSFALMAYAFVLVCAGVLQGMKQPFMPLAINVVRLILAPITAFMIAVHLFDTPNIHVGWIGTMTMAWACGLFSYFYVRRQIAALNAQ